MLNKTYHSEICTLIRSIKAGFRLKFSKPWRKFREADLVFPLYGKNTSEKVPFLLVRFLWARKENEQSKWIPVFTGMIKK
jgi:hypothetical protein